MPVALEKSSQIIDEINSMFGKKIDGCRLQSILDEAAVIERSGFYAEAKQIEGMVAGLRKDPKMVHQKFGAAIKSSGGGIVFKVNYAHAMANTGSFVEASRLMDEAAASAPDDIDTQLTAVKLYADALNIEGCDRVMGQLIRLGVAERLDPDVLEKIDDIRSTLSVCEVNWVDLARRIEFVYQIIIEAGTSPLYLGESFSHDGIYVEFGLDGDVDVAMRVENLIHEKIAALPFSAVDHVVSFGCVPE